MEFTPEGLLWDLSCTDDVLDIDELAACLLDGEEDAILEPVEGAPRGGPGSSAPAVESPSAAPQGSASDETGPPPASALEGQASAAAAAAEKRVRPRTREQLDAARVSQQAYRERKRRQQQEEQQGLQHSINVLTAQLAAMKALEVQLQERAAALTQTVTQQAEQIGSLTRQLSQTHLEMASQREAMLAREAHMQHQQNLMVGQQQMILDQHSKIKLQKQVIDQLRDQLRSAMDSALAAIGPGRVCERLIAAVKQAMLTAGNTHAMYRVVLQLPEPMVHQVAKTVFMTCREMWPELKERCAASNAAMGITDAPPDADAPRVTTVG